MWNEKKEKGEEAAGTPDVQSGEPAADGQAIIGNSIRIQGEVTGDEDLTIQGHVDGSVDLDEHAVTVGPDGQVEANILARVITVEGHVEGDLSADEQVVVRSSARVEGDISAPRVVLEDGAHFRGGVDMGAASERRGRGSGPSYAETAGSSDPGETAPESIEESADVSASEGDADAEITA